MYNAMVKAKLIRFNSFADGTRGILIFNGFHCYTLELPWKDNQPNISCIPAGEYTVVPHYSRKFKHCFHIKDVPGRTAILIHSGNFAGDRELGFRSHSYGCILVGSKFGYIYNQFAVLCSRITLSKLVDYVDVPFRLSIEWADKLLLK